MPQADVLLGILEIKPDVMCRLLQVGQARHTRVSVSNVKAARVAHIPIGIVLDGIQIWLLLDVGLHSWGHAGGTRGHSIPTGRTVSSIHRRGGTVQRRTAGKSTLKASWGTRGCAYGAINGAHDGRKISLKKTPAMGESTNVSQQAANVVTTAGVTHIERQSIHAVNELVEGCMCRILDSR
jgi:hypothetical protein